MSRVIHKQASNDDWTPDVSGRYLTSEKTLHEKVAYTPCVLSEYAAMIERPGPNVSHHIEGGYGGPTPDIRKNPHTRTGSRSQTSVRQLFDVSPKKPPKPVPH